MKSLIFALGFLFVVQAQADEIWSSPMNMKKTKIAKNHFLGMTVDSLSVSVNTTENTAKLVAVGTDNSDGGTEDHQITFNVKQDPPLDQKKCTRVYDLSTPMGRGSAKRTLKFTETISGCRGKNPKSVSVKGSYSDALGTTTFEGPGFAQIIKHR